MSAENKWQMNRAGLLNFWYYDEEMFDFEDGKLLLRGSNGSGKSVTMQSFLPVLLDGRKSPDRLDPFGSRARRMEDYLLGEQEVVDRDERTGYLFIEYKRANSDQYVTTGIGLQAKRHKQMKFWGFVITDNRRIGEDFFLYKKEKEKKIPLSRVELEHRMADGGTVVQTQHEYMKLVNRHVFGFSTLDAYEELIKLLIQIRSPKLSKDYRPTAIYEILEAALPPLTDEDLRHLSDTIEQMDQTKQQMEQLDREQEALGKLNKAYDRYNQRLLADQVDEYQKADKRLVNDEKRLAEMQERQRTLLAEISGLEEEIEQLGLEQDTLVKHEERLSSHEVWDMEKELGAEREREKNQQQKVEALEAKQENKERQEFDTKTRIREVEAEAERVHQDVQDQLEKLEMLADEAAFSGHTQNADDYKKTADEAFAFMLWEKEAKKHERLLADGEETLRAFSDLKEKVMAQKKELDEEQQHLEQVRHEEREWTRTFDEEKEKQAEAIRAWLEASELLKDSGESAFQQSTRMIYQLYADSNYEDVRAPFRALTDQFVSKQKTIIAKRDVEIGELDKQKAELEEELHTWKTKKDPEPDTQKATIEARRHLKDKGIAFESLYASVEFLEDVPEDTRVRIESALIDAGLLDALVTDGNDFSLTYDRVLMPQPKMMVPTLADYLRPELPDESRLRAETIDDALRSIMIGSESEGEATFDLDGSYRIGLLKGHAQPLERVRFVGRTARAKYREEQIERLQEEITGVESTRAHVQQIKNGAEEKMKALESNLQTFPDDSDLREIWRQLEATRANLSHLNQRVERLVETSKHLDRELREKKMEVGEKTKDVELQADWKTYRHAKEDMTAYTQDLLTLQRLHDQKQRTTERLTELSERLEELKEDVDELKGEYNHENAELSGIRLNIEQLEKQLASAGVQDLREEIQRVQKRLQEVREGLDEKKQTVPAKRVHAENGDKEIQDKERAIAFTRQLRNLWHATVEKEWKRGFVFGEDGPQSFSDLVSETMKQYGAFVKDQNAAAFERHLTNQFHEQQTDLMEYRMKDYTVSENLPEELEAYQSEEEQMMLRTWETKSERRMIELYMRGQSVSPYAVAAYVNEEQERQQDILNEADKELYEEILFKSVGMKLRSRIRRAEMWTKEMNKIMGSRNISSGLTFSIKWKPRTAESEDEMDTRDLVHHLKQDAKLLKDEDLERITTHFRSKIARAKQLIQDEGDGETLLQVLKEVLDYRKWFSFKIYFQRTNEPVRELSNNQFYKFSGGEKALAMYIPLLTACYSRYQEASPQAPYIISLDEAFAGVDENNIREMFEVVEQLGFDYIMNSQVLWGDYDTVPSLSIYELLRAKNADYVTTIHYRWNGEKIAMQMPEPVEV
ncbi:TIGR02680 family protein [Salicibibacter cibi]|uniref:TIGR02680 family protein n=1 Tax=Salicibibacter cibi TaxID=2743001 RepID=A0A7T7CG21_9BACI|nr:TIGR02680 family protein [Salicibibacter cibi]QQK80747.1 TIGR02680 family protein [Salicibibacter cibi]